MDTVLIKCQSCGAVNKVGRNSLDSQLRCGKCKQQLQFPNKPVDVTEAHFSTEVLGWPGLVLVDFWSPYCGYCVRLNPELGSLADRYRGQLKIAKINILTETLLAQKYQVLATPTLMLFRHGTQIDRLNGAPPPHQLETWIRGRGGLG